MHLFENMCVKVQNATEHTCSNTDTCIYLRNGCVQVSTLNANQECSCSATDCICSHIGHMCLFCNTGVCYRTPQTRPRCSVTLECRNNSMSRSEMMSR